MFSSSSDCILSAGHKMAEFHHIWSASSSFKMQIKSDFNRLIHYKHGGWSTQLKQRWTVNFVCFGGFQERKVCVSDEEGEVRKTEQNVQIREALSVRGSSLPTLPAPEVITLRVARPEWGSGRCGTMERFSCRWILLTGSFNLVSKSLI